MFSVNSLGFLVLLAVFVPLWFTARPDRRWQWMLAANLLFYLSIDVPGLFVLLASAALVWLSAKNVRPGMPRRRRWIALGVSAALAPLLLLKYSGMFADAAGTLLGIPLWDGSGLLQPLGLAYFSLQLASYLIDVSRGDLAPEPLYARVLCYASFFFSITQGPFNRYGTLMPQLAAPTRFDSHRLWRGAMRMAWGYFKKYAIAERAAVVVSAAFSTPEIYDTSQLVFGTVLYSFQLYADFSGYTDIVLGAGEILGLRLPENFRQPFLAATVRELWSRWHISLSQWFRDYVYIPLGGNRKGPPRCQPDPYLFGKRPLAWRQLDLSGLGRPARRDPGNRKPSALAQEDHQAADQNLWDRRHFYGVCCDLYHLPRRQHRCGGRVFPLPCDDARL